MPDHTAKNRQEAGRELAKLLTKYKGTEAIVLGLPRGGVVTAKAVAEILQLPLCLVVVKKIGQPGNAEYALGAVSESGEVAKNGAEVADVDENWWEEELKAKLAEAKSRALILRAGCAGKDLAGKIAIIVDDGIATGYTVMAAIKEVKKRQAKKVVVAVPVSPRDTTERIKKMVDEMVVTTIPEMFVGSVGAYYQDFPQVEDAEVIELLQVAHKHVK